MLTGVIIMLAAESLLVRSWHLAAWMAAFFLGNLVYFSRVEEPGLERTEEDFDAIARRIEALGADVVAFQEVENAAAARRVFNPAKWNIVMSSRPDTGEGPACYNRPEGRLRHQGTGIAVRRSVAYRRGTDLSALGGGNPFLRWGTHIVVGRGERRVHVLSVHLKSGCWGMSQDEQGRESCTVPRSQMNVLRNWIDERQREGERFVIAGDFNRRLAIPGDWAWALLAPTWRAGGGEGPAASPGSWSAGDGGWRDAGVALELGYALATGGGRGSARPYVGVEWAGDVERTVQIGARWRWGEACGLSLGAERDEGGTVNGVYALIAGAELRW